MNAELGREQLRELIPHAGDMCLLERVIAWSNEHIECAAQSHSHTANPLRHGGQLDALHLAEYAAQAMAVHGALISSGGARPGLLAALRDIRLYTDRIDTIETALIIRATRRILRRDGALYDFAAIGDGHLLAEGRVAIALTLSRAWQNSGGINRTQPVLARLPPVLPRHRRGARSTSGLPR